MISLLRFSVRYPIPVLVVCSILLVMALPFIGQIELRLDGRSLIPESHPAMAASDAAAERFQLRDVVVLALQVGPDQELYSPSVLRDLVILSQGLDALQGIVTGSVNSLSTVPRLYIEEGILDLRPLLVEATEIDDETARRLRHETLALGLDDGVLVDELARAVGIYAQVDEAADRLLLNEDIQGLIENSNLTTAVHYSGTALAQAALGNAAAIDLARLVPLVILIVGLVLGWTFRHPAPALVSLAEIGVSLVWTIGLLGAGEQPIFVTTLALPVILVVIGVSDDIYALNHLFEQARERPDRPFSETLVVAFSSVQKPILLTSVTTIVGLLCLILTRLEPQRIFGAYGALAVLFSTLLTFTLVPAMLVLMHPRVAPLASQGGTWSQIFIARLQRIAGRLKPTKTLILALGLSGLAILLLVSRLEIDDNWVRNLPTSSEIVRGDQAINRLLAGTNTLDLMFDSGVPDGFLQPDTFLALGEIERRLLEHPSVGAVDGLFSQLLRVCATLAEDEVDVPAFASAVLDGGRELTASEIEQSLLMLESLRRSPLVDRLDLTRQRTRMTVFVRSADSKKIAEVLTFAETVEKEMLATNAGVVAFGDGWIGLTTVRLLVEGQFRSIGLALLLDILLLAILFTSLRAALVAVSPVFFGVLMVSTSLALTNTPLGTANSMFAAIALGIGVDYSIHLVSYHREQLKWRRSTRKAIEAAFHATGPAIVISAIAIASGFLVLGFSEVLPNRQLGWLIAFSMATCGLITLVLVPSLILLRRE